LELVKKELGRGWWRTERDQVAKTEDETIKRAKKISKD